MSDSHLPDDIAAWPSDPYRLLGVTRRTPLREIKQAYRRLIRQFKPEQAPAAFRLIRDAWEAIEVQAPAPQPEASSDFDPVAGDPTANWSFSTQARPTFEPPEPTPDVFWELAATGEFERAYQGLLARVERGSRREADFLQLHWLLAIRPELDPTQDPADWLIVGVRAIDTAPRRLAELIRRRAEADPEWAVGERCAVLLAGRLATATTRQLATWRWRAARRLARWGVIEADLALLRPGELTDGNVEGWVHLLFLAAENLAWALDLPDRLAPDHYAEAVRLATDHALDVEDALLRADYVAAVVAGMRHYVWVQHAELELSILLRNGWDERGAAEDRALHAWASRVAAHPRAALRQIAQLFQVAPAAIGLLWDFLGGVRSLPNHDPATVRVVEPMFLGHLITTYGSLQPKVLDLCLRERFEPATVAAVLAHRNGLNLMDGRPVANVIATDWPLMVVYRAIVLVSD